MNIKKYIYVYSKSGQWDALKMTNAKNEKCGEVCCRWIIGSFIDRREHNLLIKGILLCVHEQRSFKRSSTSVEHPNGRKNIFHIIFQQWAAQHIYNIIYLQISVDKESLFEILKTNNSSDSSGCSQPIDNPNYTILFQNE